MPKFVLFPCGCGRTVRAWDYQAGAAVRCWGCRDEVTVPHPKLVGRVLREMGQGYLDLPHRELLGMFLIGGGIATGLLLLGQLGLAVIGVGIAAAVVAFRGAIGRGFKLAIGGLRRHPVSILAALIVLPLGLVLVEAATVAVAYQQNWLRYLVLDVTPPRGAVTVLRDRPDFGAVDYSLISDAELFRIYARGLAQGHALAWDIPASLIRGMTQRADAAYFSVNAVAWNDWVDPVSYLSFRAVCTIGVVSALLSLLALELFWIRLIGRFQVHRDVPPILPPNHFTWESRQAAAPPLSWTGIGAQSFAEREAVGARSSDRGQPQDT